MAREWLYSYVFEVELQYPLEAMKPRGINTRKLKSACSELVVSPAVSQSTALGACIFRPHSIAKIFRESKAVGLAFESGFRDLEH